MGMIMMSRIASRVALWMSMSSHAAAFVAYQRQTHGHMHGLQLMSQPPPTACTRLPPLVLTTTTSQRQYTPTHNHDDIASTVVSSASSSSSSSPMVALAEDDDKRIRLPMLKYGYRTEPMNWKELVDIIRVQQNYELLCRSVEDQRDYEIYKRDTIRVHLWSSILDHVLCQKFPSVFTKQWDDELGRYVASPSLNELVVSGRSYIALTRNDFPYYVESNIEHWILWKLGKNACSDADFHIAKTKLQSRLDEKSLLCWINPPNQKSLPEIHHIHILGKLRSPSGVTNNMR